MYRIGLTGGIASGKSVVSEMLASMGAVVIDTDAIAREVVLPGRLALEKIVEHFGKSALLPDGSLNRRYIGNIIFSDQAERGWLENLLHPLIRAEAEEAVNQAAANGHKIVVLDVPLLFESGWNKNVDECWSVIVSEATQKVRLASRDNLSCIEIEARIKSQMPLHLKANQADVIIDNNGALEETRQQVKASWEKVLQAVGGIG